MVYTPHRWHTLCNQVMRLWSISLVVLSLVSSALSSLAEEKGILHFLDLEPGDDHLDSDFTTKTSPAESSGDDEGEESVTTEVPTSEQKITDLSYQMLWVTRYRSDGRVVTASHKELDDLIKELPSKESRRLLCSSGSLFPEDGPGMLLEKYNMSLIGHDEEQPLDYLERLPCAQLPGNTIGLLAHESCSAFLVGPRHAMTTARCVYEHSSQAWEEQLDLYRGRNCSTYQQLMHWESVRIPAGYHSRGDSRLNWALITYTADTQSFMWASIGFDPSFSNRLVYLTVAGYCDSLSSGCLYSSECFSLAQSSLPWEHNMLVECGVQVGFHGGPLLAGKEDYFTKKTHSRSVYGISMHTQNTNHHNILRITENLFWQVCLFVGADGHDLRCGVANQ